MERANAGAIFDRLGVDFRGGSGEALHSRDPATGAGLGAVSASTREDYDRAVEAALSRFEEWRLRPAPRRAEVVRRLGELLRQGKEPLGRAGLPGDGQDPRRGPGRGAGDDRHLRLRGRAVAAAPRAHHRLRAAAARIDGAVASRWGRSGSSPPSTSRWRCGPGTRRSPPSAATSACGSPRRSRRCAAPRCRRLCDRRGARITTPKASSRWLPVAPPRASGSATTAAFRWSPSPGRSPSAGRWRAGGGAARPQPARAGRQQRRRSCSTTRTSTSPSAPSSSARWAPPASAAPPRGASSCSAASPRELTGRLVAAYRTRAHRRSARRRRADGPARSPAPRWSATARRRGQARRSRAERCAAAGAPWTAPATSSSRRLVAAPAPRRVPHRLGGDLRAHPLPLRGGRSRRGAARAQRRAAGTLQRHLHRQPALGGAFPLRRAGPTAASPTSTPAPAARRSAAPSAARRTPAAAASPAPTPGRPTCAARPPP